MVGVDILSEEGDGRTPGSLLKSRCEGFSDRRPQELSAGRWSRGGAMARSSSAPADRADRAETASQRAYFTFSGATATTSTTKEI